jgi:hypothetical protein
MARERHGFLYRNGLALVFGALVLLSLSGHALAGWAYDGATRREHGEPAQAFVDYLGSGAFLSSVFENWESEFLQMGLFVLLTVWLRQRGSSESRKLDPDEEPAPKQVPLAEQPWPMRRGGIWKRLYGHSLSAALLALFVASAVGHFLASWHHHTAEQVAQGMAPTPMLAYLAGAQFWFESLQNWQSEFLALGVMLVLSIVLRQKGSPVSKPVAAPHHETGHAY